MTIQLPAKVIKILSVLADSNNPVRRKDLMHFAGMKKTGWSALFGAHTKPDRGVQDKPYSHLVKATQIKPELYFVLSDEGRAALKEVRSGNVPTLDQSLSAESLAAAIEDAAFAGQQGTNELLNLPATRYLTRAELEKARQAAEQTGARGEKFVKAFLAREVAIGRIRSFEWSSQTNPVSPFDFKVIESGGNAEIDAKSTNGEFERRIHISIGELRRMATTTSRYDLYRIFSMNGDSAKIRICNDVREFASKLFAKLSDLPVGISVDSVSVDPATLPFAEEIELSLGSVDALMDATATR